MAEFSDGLSRCQAAGVAHPWQCAASANAPVSSGPALREATPLVPLHVCGQMVVALLLAVLPCKAELPSDINTARDAYARISRQEDELTADSLALNRLLLETATPRLGTAPLFPLMVSANIADSHLRVSLFDLAYWFDAAIRRDAARGRPVARRQSGGAGL